METAFHNVKVLDLSRLLPGPFCSMMLADFGADVIKIEDPKGGDYVRAWEPKLGKNSGFHVVLNRNKRSMTLDLKTEEGRAIFKKMVVTADVVIEGFRPGVMDKLGLGYDSLCKLNPKIIYCAITGYGLVGPYANKAGHDINYLATSGILSYSGRENLSTVSGVQIADIGGGALLAAFSVATALYAREKLGKGQFIDISMTDGAMSWNCLRWGKYLADGILPTLGDDMLNHGYACYNIYNTKDGRHMSLGALEPQFWKAFCDALERPEWYTKEYFSPGPHQQVLHDEVASVFAERTLAEWTQFFEENANCCCEPVLNLAEVMDSELAKKRNLVVELTHAKWGAYKQLGIAPKFSLTPGSIRTHAPELGEHTQEILNQFGLSDSDYKALQTKGVV